MRQRNPNTEETRALLLATGRRLLVERGIPVEVKSVSLVDVAKAAGRTTGSAYQLWKTQEAFHRELASFSLRDTAYADASLMIEVVTRHLENQSPLPLLLRDVANTYLDSVLQSREFFVFSHFWAVAIDEPDIRTAMAESYATYQRLNKHLMEVVLHTYGRSLKPHLTIDDLAVAVGALFEGYVLRYKISPELAEKNIVRMEYPTAYRTGWNSFGCAVEALAMQFTQEA